MAHLRLMVYDKEHLEEVDDMPLAEAIERAKQPDLAWISLYEPTDEEFRMLEEDLGLHPLAIEDSRNERQRPKVEDFPDNTYVVARSMMETDAGLSSHQTNIFFGKTWVVVIHERPLGIFDEVRDRIRRGRPRIRSSGADYLVYALLDAIVDTYFPLLESIGERIEDLEENIESNHEAVQLEEVHGLKRDLRRLRRSIWPAREAMAALLRNETAGFKKTTLPFLRDVHDHTVQAIDLIESHREAATSLTDLYMTMVSNRMNEVMKVLTIVATIFIPITFLAGVYGMNFDTDSPYNMPELGWVYGYPAFLVVAALVIIAELWYFRRRKWI